MKDRTLPLMKAAARTISGPLRAAGTITERELGVTVPYTVARTSGSLPLRKKTPWVRSVLSKRRFIPLSSIRVPGAYLPTWPFSWLRMVLMTGLTLPISPWLSRVRAARQASRAAAVRLREISALISSALSKASGAVWLPPLVGRKRSLPSSPWEKAQPVLHSVMVSKTAVRAVRICAAQTCAALIWKKPIWKALIWKALC